MKTRIISYLWALWPYFVILLSTLLHFFRQIRTGTNLSQFLSTDTVCVRVCVCMPRSFDTATTRSAYICHPTSTSKFLWLPSTSANC